MFDTKIRLYAIFIIASIIIGLIIVYINSKKYDLRKDKALALLFYIVIGVAIGSKYFSFFSDPEKYNNSFDFFKIGSSAYGAVIGVAIMLLLYSFQYKDKIKTLCYIVSPSLPLMYAIGKIGCFFGGCCYGIDYNGPFKVVYNYSQSAPKGESLFPIQLLESIVFFVLFIYAFYIVKNKKEDDMKFGRLIVLCGCAKFFLDYLRMSHIGKLLSINQIVSIIFILIGGVIIIFSKLKSKHVN